MGKPDEKLSDERLREASALSCLIKTGAIQPGAEAARERQRRRFAGRDGLLSNADALANARDRPAEVRVYCQVDDAGRNLLRAAMQQLHMSARAYDELSSSSLHPEAGADPRRPGRQRNHRDRPPGRGDSVSPQKANVTRLTVL